MNELTAVSLRQPKKRDFEPGFRHRLDCDDFQLLKLAGFRLQAYTHAAGINAGNNRGGSAERSLSEVRLNLAIHRGSVKPILKSYAQPTPGIGTVII